MNPYKIIIADDHEVVMQGIDLMLAGERLFELVGAAHSIQEVFSLVREKNPDLALLDLNMHGKNTLDYIEELKDLFPNLKTMIISSYNEPTLVNVAKDKGMDGYIIKNTNKSDLLEILKIVLEGGKHFIKNTSDSRINRSLESPIVKDAFIKRELLSEREIEVIRLVAKGQTEKEMAAHLNLSKHTIHTHRKNIMKKLELRSAVDIVRYAYENHLIE